MARPVNTARPMEHTRSALVLAIALIGCGSSHGHGGPGSPDAASSADASLPGDASVVSYDAPTAPSGRYEPWHVGAVWTYHLTDPTGALPAVTAKTTMVSWENMPSWAGPNAGKPAYKIHEEKLVGSLDAWESFEGDNDVRYAQIDYDQTNAVVDTQYEVQWRLKLDESAAHIAANATWTESFDETTTVGTATTTKAKTESWQVVNPAESVTVLAGTYTALHVRRTSTSGVTPKMKDYWFVKDVGKVKETGGSQDEELMSYTP
jgi:hypothetical protein